MTIVTPDLAGDLSARLAELVGWLVASGDGQTLFSATPEEAGGKVGPLAAFLMPSSELQFRVAGNASQPRAQQWQLLMRARVASRTEHLEHLRRADAAYDALHLSGAFTGAVSSYEYLDLECLDRPVPLEPKYFSLNLQVWMPT